MNDYKKNDNTDYLKTAEGLLIDPYDLDYLKISSVVSNLMSRKIDYADIYFQYTKSESWSLEEGIIKTGSFNIDKGFGVRSVAGEKSAFAYSDDI